ncbi:serine/threonine-protein kinase LMTK1-like isoform X2 [Porites lutea]|uniref:serine/threonine-protein kinase LMTK1-like isoform X2 n=1 Tax=Porites lutea TaxID=51062 RepID=UPI003CC508E0
MYKLASMRGRYRTMRDEADNTVQNNGFIMGFSNPLTESVADKTDGSVTVLGYRSLGEDSNKDGVKDYSHAYKSMFPRDRLVFGTELGTGWFGKVFEGDAFRIKAGWRRTKVVIKELRRNSDSQMKQIFRKEMEIFRHVEHKNVLSVLGQATEQEPWLFILEHTPVGDLKKFLLEQRYNKKREGVPLPLRMSIDIASGLHCLHANYFYHSDLAARNCLVFPDLTVKLGDYGISRCTYKNDYYNRPNAPNTIPLRWLAPEGLVIQEDGILVPKPPSSGGNVWSFGVTLWEIIEGGKQPYEELSDEEVLQSVIQDRLYTLPEPCNKDNVQDSLYELMSQCWVESDKRPSVPEIESALLSLMSGRSVPRLTSSGILKQKPDGLLESHASREMKLTSQPVAIVHPLRPNHSENKTSSNEDGTHDSSSDVEVTVISSESPPPVTYIGNASEELGETSVTSEATSPEVGTSDSQSHVIIESDSVSREYVMMPGEVIRRRGSILKNPNAPSKPAKVVHFPVNILALRTVHKYERMESYEEECDSEPEGDDTEDAGVASMWSLEYPIASEEIENEPPTFPVEKDIESLDSITAEENGSVFAKVVSLSDSPVEKKMKKAARRKKLEECNREWVSSIVSNMEEPA